MLVIISLFPRRFRPHCPHTLFGLSHTSLTFDDLVDHFLLQLELLHVQILQQVSLLHSVHCLNQQVR